MSATDKTVTVLIHSIDRINYANSTASQYTVMVPALLDLAAKDCDLYECYLDAFIPCINGTSKQISTELTGFYELGFNFQCPYRFNSSRISGMYVMPSDSTNTTTATFQPQNPVVVTKQSLLNEVSVTIYDDTATVITSPAGADHIIKLTFVPLRLPKVSDIRI